MLKKLFNRSEEVVDSRLGLICQQHGARVCPKVRVADVLSIENSGISEAEYAFALRAHFDFLVVGAQRAPLFAVEFDGPAHDSLTQQQRDALKDRLCAHFKLPLLRCRSAHIDYRLDGWDLLSWLVDVWFMRESANRLQEGGLLPFDFDFDPALVLSSPKRSRKFPYWLGLDAQLKLLRLHEAGQVADGVPGAMYQGVDEHSVRRGFAYWRLDSEMGVRATCAMRAQQFVADFHEAMQGILMNALLREVEAVLQGRQERLRLADLDAELRELRRNTRMLSLFGGTVR